VLVEREDGLSLGMHKLSASASDLASNVDAVERKESTLLAEIEACNVRQETLDGLVMRNREEASRLSKQAYEYNERERGIGLRVKGVEEMEQRMAATLFEKRRELEAEFEGMKIEVEKEKEVVMKEFGMEYQARLKTLADEFAFVEREKAGVRVEKEQMRQDRDLLFDIKVARGSVVDPQKGMELERENGELREEINLLNLKLSEPTSTRISEVKTSEGKDTNELMNVILSLTSYVLFF
jgi:uncharacterized protein (DUF3084 family)